MMIEVSKYSDNTYILNDVDRQINVANLNTVINILLKNRGELDRYATVKRAVRQDDYVTVDGYGSFSQDKLENVITYFLKEYKISYSFVDYKKIENLKLPVKSIRKRSQCGGCNPDTLTIDPNIKCLCNVVNKFPGVETFSSCEGHPGSLWVLFTVDTMDNLIGFSNHLYNSLEETAGKYPIDFKLNFDSGRWEHRKDIGVYFQIIAEYIDQQMAFEAVKYLSKKLEGELNE